MLLHPACIGRLRTVRRFARNDIVAEARGLFYRLAQANGQALRPARRSVQQRSNTVNRLNSFYLGSRRDDRGRLLSDILRMDDDWLERTHDYIQWLFPLPEPSAVNPTAPLVTPEVRDAFRDDVLMRRHLRASLVRMLRFYGLELADGLIRPAANWDERKRAWFTTGGHNDLRITRILRCLSVLGLADEARALLACLETLRRDEPVCGVNRRAFEYWRAAVESG